MDPDGSIRIEIVEEAGDWALFDAANRLDAIAEAVAGSLDNATGTVVLVLADDAFVQDLNRRFRCKDKPTNVLSFPGEDTPPPGMPPENTHLGDVVLAAETLAREARSEGKSINDHFTHLAIHGILHLLGYDHETNEDAAVMESLETAILADLGVADPYAEAALATGDH